MSGARHFSKLITTAHATRAALQQAAGRLTGLAGVTAAHWRARVNHYLPLIARIINPDPTPGVRWRDGTGERKAGQPV